MVLRRVHAGGKLRRASDRRGADSSLDCQRVYAWLGAKPASLGCYRGLKSVKSVAVTLILLKRSYPAGGQKKLQHRHHAAKSRLRVVEFVRVRHRRKVSPVLLTEKVLDTLCVGPAGVRKAGQHTSR